MSLKRKRLTLQEKVEIIKVYDKEKGSVRDLASRFGVGKTQIGDLIKSKDKIMKLWVDNVNGSSKRAFPKTEGLAVDKMTYEWFCRARSNNIPLSGPIIREKALQIAQELGHTDFKASVGWLDRFRVRHNISYRNICGEGADVNADVVDHWKKKMKDLCEGYLERDCYNCDETGLFFRALPDKTMTLKTEKCTGGKISKERLTVLLCVNMEGAFEKPLIIGKSKQPRCFKGNNINSLGIEWYANKRAWMTRDIMSEWLMSFDRRLGQLKRKILLFMDNAASHPDGLQLENIKVMFLPPNTTSACQPLDQGIIKNFKVLYRQKVLRHLLSKINDSVAASDLARKITFIDAIMWVKSSVGQITSQTVRNCFLKAGVPGEDFHGFEAAAENDGEVQLNELLKQYGEPAVDYVSIDDVVQTEDPSVKISDLVALVQETTTSTTDEQDQDSSDNADSTEEEASIKNVKEAIQASRQLKLFFLQKGDADGLKMVTDIEMHLKKLLALSKLKLVIFLKRR